ncbi:hypothetical protein NLU13_4372 [Sarocladium strictum]|uniref:ERCC4 domain-containing protein n=1 Tax=Sarocladium strictum TaxID=5046 RepID=A0AA39L8L2_SARSR|nr:hypothetical protein NLU13_4372 [Sarocladium strictum]
MAPEVVDLISSSPSPKSCNAQPHNPGGATPPVLAFGSGSRSNHLPPSHVDSTTVIFPSSYSTLPSSDTGPNVISRELPLEVERSPKRRRFNPEGSPRGNMRAPPCDADKIPETTASKLRLDRGTESISGVVSNVVLSSDSDPFASSPIPGKSTSINRAVAAVVDLSSPKQASQSTKTVKDTAYDERDVFLSSPEPIGVLKSGNGRGRQPSPNPFPISPAAGPSISKQCKQVARTAPESSDPFQSSPPQRLPGRPAAGSIPAVQQQPRKLQEYDPISSSAPEPSAVQLSRSNRLEESHADPKPVITIDDTDSGPEKSSEDELPDLRNIKPVVSKRPAHEPMRRALSDTYATDRRPSSRLQARSKTSAEQRTKDREAKLMVKEADKEAKKQEREQQKRIRQLEKEKAAALAEVNKIRTDKKVSTKEMIVDLPAGLDEILKTHVETILEGLGVQHTRWQSPVPNVVKLRRKVDSRFDDDLGHWVPCPRRIVDEDHVIIVVTALELVQVAQDGLDAFVQRITAKLPTKRHLYILEGVTPWMRKNRNARNRQFASSVRGQTTGNPAGASSQSRRRTTPPAPISDDIVEDAMLQLQVRHGALIHHTNIPLETAQWIGHFTQHLSTAPYRRQRELSTTVAGFCMDTGQVRTGDDVADTYVRLLQEVARVTQPVAYGVAAEFGSVTKLVKGLEEGGPGRLEAVRKCANRDGAFSDRTLGKAMSKRLWQVFLGRDETSTDI